MDYNFHLCNWIQNEIYDNSLVMKPKDSSLDEFLINNLHFVTFNFDPKRISTRRARSDELLPVGQMQIRQFNHFYNTVCRTIQGRNYHRLGPAGKPMAIMGFDANGSRYGREMGEIENVHLHTIWVMPPGTNEALFTARDRALQQHIFDFAQIDIKPFQANGSAAKSLKKMISYTLKFDRFNQRDAEIQDTFRIYPERADGLYGASTSW